MNFQDLNVDLIAKKALLMVSNILRLEAEVVWSQVIHFLRDANHSFIRNQIRVATPNDRLKRTQVRTGSRGRSELRSSARITKDGLCSGSRPSMSRETPDFEHNPETHDIGISGGEAIPVAESKDHVRPRERRGVQDPAKI